MLFRIIRNTVVEGLRNPVLHPVIPCRYRFPRPRVPLTHMSSNGIEIARALGHEFINGYNSVIMLGSKCNHDIQVLLGGSDISIGYTIALNM